MYRIQLTTTSKFRKSISRCSILYNVRISNFVILKWQPFESKAKFEISIFHIFFKRLYEESFKNLQINST